MEGVLTHGAELIVDGSGQYSIFHGQEIGSGRAVLRYIRWRWLRRRNVGNVTLKQIVPSCTYLPSRASTNLPPEFRLFRGLKQAPILLRAIARGHAGEACLSWELSTSLRSTIIALVPTYCRSITSSSRRTKILQFLVIELFNQNEVSELRSYFSLR